MSGDWLDLTAECRARGEGVVLVTVAAVKGSAPREAGAKMAVSATLAAGSIGGGHLEHEAMAAARALLAEGAETPQLRDYPLGPSLGQCCGGHVTLLYEPLPAPALQIALFGAGHVAQALVRVLDGVPCRIHWIDARGQAFPPELPVHAQAIASDDPAGEVGLLPEGAHCLIMTHSHALDFDILDAALRRGRFASVGLIGSASKWASFRARLAARGIAPADLDRVRCPVGLPGIAGKRPAEIAIAVAAQLLSGRG